MKDSIFTRIKRYALPGLITLFGMVLILILKGIWPFGSNRIDLFDNMQQVAPLYCHLWDWMHGKASIWFDWYTGLGTNVSMSISAFSMLSPFNLLLYLVPRSYILEFISVLTIVKTVFMAVAMYALLEYRYTRLNNGLKTMYAVMYAFCGYVIVYGSCFTPWMDIVALFPLLMMSCDYLIKTGRKLPYILMLGLVFIINYYLAAMSLVYIFFACGIQMFTRMDKDKRKSAAWNIGIGTVAGMALSAFVLIPVILQLSTSQRSAGSTGGILSQYIGWITSKAFNGRYLALIERFIMVYGMAFVILVIVAGIRQCKKNIEELGYVCGMLALVVIPVISEGTNLMWHFGSYNGYTLRMGYVIAFTLICLAAELGQNVLVTKMVPRKCIVVQVICGIAACAAYVAGYNIIPDNNEKIAMWFFLGLFFAFLIVYLVYFIVNKWKVNPWAITGIIVIELFIGAYSFIGPPKFYTLEAYQYGDYVEYANDAKESLNINESVTDRIINPDISLNANYPLVLRRGAQSSFTAALLADTQDSSVKLGYSRYFLWLLDSGGTVFSDAMLHVTEAVNQNELDKSLYTLETTGGTLGDYKLYSANYQLPFAMYAANDIADMDTEGKDWVDVQNELYSYMEEWAGLDNKSQLITRYNGGTAGDFGEPSYYLTTYKFDVEGREALYLSADAFDSYKDGEDDNDGICDNYQQARIKVNGRFVKIPTLGDLDNELYSTFYNNNTVYLGIFEDEQVTIEIHYKEPKPSSTGEKKPNFVQKNDLTIAGLSLDKLEMLCDVYNNKVTSNVTNDNSSVTVKVSGSNAQSSVILPVIYFEDNWTVTVDGKEADVKNVAGMFTCVNVDAGEHTIKMTFKAKGTDIGLVITLIALALTITGGIAGHIKAFKTPAVCNNIAGCIYKVLFFAGCIFMFAVPLICSFGVDILQIFGLY